MPKRKSLVPAARIESAILKIRVQRVMLDADLVKLYGVETKALKRHDAHLRAIFQALRLLVLPDDSDPVQ